MKLLMLFATIYVVFLPTSLSVLVPEASVIDWTSSKNDDQHKASLTIDSKEQNELELKNTIDYKPSLNSNNSNDSGNNHEAFQYARLYYLIFFQPYIVGNISKWQKNHYYSEAFDNTHDKDIDRYENVTEGVLSGENKKILNRKPIYPHWYVMHMPSNKKNATNGTSNMKQYNGNPKRKSGPTNFIQPHPTGKVSEWQNSSYEEDAMDNAYSKGVNHYENVTGDVIFEENMKVLNNKASYPRWYVILVPNKEKVANGTFNKKQYSNIAKGKFEPTDDSHVKRDIGNSERKHMETVESNGKHTNVSKSKKVYPKIFYFGNEQNLKLNNESEKNSVIPIFQSLFAKYFKDGGKNGESNKDWKASFKINFTISPDMFGSNEKSREATGVVQPEEKEHEAKYNKYSFYSFLGEYPEGITTQNTHGLKHYSGETQESNKQFQMKDTRENHPRKEWKGEGHDNEAHDAYFIISNFADERAKFSRQKRQVKTNKESEGGEQGKSDGNLHDIRTERPLSNASKISGNTIEKPSNNASVVDNNLVKKLQNSPTRNKDPIDGTVSKFSKENGALIFNPNPMTSDKFNSSMTPAKSLNAFPKSDSNNRSSFHPIQSKSNPKEAVNFNVGYQKDIKSMEEGKIISESVLRSTKISAETAVGNTGNHSILETKITPVKYSDTNDRKETRNRNGTMTKPNQTVANSSFIDTKNGSKTFLNNTSHNSYRLERSLEHPFLTTDLMEDTEAGTTDDSCLVVSETVKLVEISHTNNPSMEEHNRQDLMYRSHENVSDTVTSSVNEALNMSKVDTSDREKQVPQQQTMTEVTGRTNITTQKPVIFPGVKNDEATYRMNDSHKFKDGIHATTVKTEVLNENVTLRKILLPLHHTDNTSGAEVKNIEAVAYLNNDATKPFKTVTDETQVVNSSNNGEVKESNKTTLNDNLEITSGAEVKNIEAVAYRNNDATKPFETITDETQVVNRSNNGEAKEPNQTTLNDNLGRNSTGSHLMKEVTLNATKTEKSQTYENNTTTEIMTETETRSKSTDDPPHVNRHTNPGRKREILYLSKQLVGTNGNNNTETKIADQEMLGSDKLNATGGNLNETDGTKIKPQQRLVPEQMQTFGRFIFASKNVSGSRTKEPNAYMTTESVIDNQQENTRNKHMQTVNRITNMTGWFERKKMNAEKEASGMETIHPSKLDKNKDDPFNDKAVTSDNSKNATSLEIRPKITTAHPRYLLQNSEKRADNTYEANPTVSDDSGVNVVSEKDKFQLADRKETAVVKN